MVWHQFSVKQNRLWIIGLGVVEGMSLIGYVSLGLGEGSEAWSRVRAAEMVYRSIIIVMGRERYGENFNF